MKKTFLSLCMSMLALSSFAVKNEKGTISPEKKPFVNLFYPRTEVVIQRSNCGTTWRSTITYDVSSNPIDTQMNRYLHLQNLQTKINATCAWFEPTVYVSYLPMQEEHVQPIEADGSEIIEDLPLPGSEN